MELFKESKDKPEEGKVPQNLKKLSTGEFFDEIERRLDILAQSKWIFQGLGLRLLGKTATEVIEKINNDSQYDKHKKYVESIDVYKDEVEGGFHIGVDAKVEKDALIAEMGTSLTPKQELWRPISLKVEEESRQLIKDFFELLAKKLENGEPFKREEIDEIIEKPEMGEGVFPEYRKLVEEYNKLSDKEEVD